MSPIRIATVCFATIAAVVAGVAVPVATATALEPMAVTVVAAPPPGLSISLGDGVAQTQSGETLTYRATVTNAGARSVSGTLGLTIPGYASYEGASRGTGGHDLRWAITVGAGKTVSKTATVKISTIPKGEVRFTTIATLYPASGGTQILVRTADPDAIRGVVDPAHSVGQDRVPKNSVSPALVALLGLLAVAGAILIGILIRVRRGSRANSGESSGEQPGV